MASGARDAYEPSSIFYTVWSAGGPSNDHCESEKGRMKNRMRPIHPGEILREEYLTPLGMSANRLAQVLGIPTNRLTEIMAGRRSVTADTALRLGRAFRTSPEFWLDLQKAFDLRVAEQQVGAELRRIKPVSKLAREDDE